MARGYLLKYCADMSSFRQVVADKLATWVWGCTEPELLSRRFSLANRRWRLPLEVHWNGSDGFFRVRGDGDEILVARPSRVRYFQSGIVSREEQLIREYCLGKIPFRRGDLIVDIGANIGEVSRLLARRHGVTPLAIEPENREFAALEENLAAFGGRCWNTLLWSEPAELEFFDANDSGDSSIFEPRTGLRSELRQARTLDSVLADGGFGDSALQLIKVEAEGAEPEVLAGGQKALQRAQYVTVDAGPERGPNKETTLIPVYEMLQGLGFRAIDVYQKRLVVLFKRVD